MTKQTVIGFYWAKAAKTLEFVFVFSKGFSGLGPLLGSGMLEQETRSSFENPGCGDSLRPVPSV